MNSRQFCSALLLNLLIFGYVIPASCQSEPIITDFSPQTLTWTNQQPNTYCDIEWNCNLNHEWVGTGLNQLTTQAVTTVDIDALHNLAEQVQWLCRNAPEGTYAGFFLRVASSEQPIQPHVFTNSLRLSNVSTSVLENITFGLKQNWSYVPLTNFPSVLPMATTDMINVWSPFPNPTDPNPPVYPIGTVQNGGYVSYDHNGSNRVSQIDIMPVGPIEKNILLTVSNNSLTVNLEWLRLTQTKIY